MTTFHTRAEHKVSQLKESFTRLKEKTEDTAEFFGEPDDLEWEQIFKTFLKFFELYSKAYKALDDMKKKEEKERAQKEKEEKKKAQGAKSGNRKATLVGAGEKEPSNILEEIRLRSTRGILMPERSTSDPKSNTTTPEQTPELVPQKTPELISEKIPELASEKTKENDKTAKRESLDDAAWLDEITEDLLED